MTLSALSLDHCRCGWMVHLCSQTSTKMWRSRQAFKTQWRCSSNRRPISEPGGFQSLPNLPLCDESGPTSFQSLSAEGGRRPRAGRARSSCLRYLHLTYLSLLIARRLQECALCCSGIPTGQPPEMRWSLRNKKRSASIIFGVVLNKNNLGDFSDRVGMKMLEVPSASPLSRFVNSKLKESSRLPWDGSLRNLLIQRIHHIWKKERPSINSYWLSIAVKSNSQIFTVTAAAGDFFFKVLGQVEVFFTKLIRQLAALSCFDLNSGVWDKICEEWIS